MGKKKVKGKVYCPGCQSGNIIASESHFYCRGCGITFEENDGLVLVPKKAMDCE